VKVLFIPSWYPSSEHPTAGVFVYQQVEAVRGELETAVLYVREARDGLAPALAKEDGLPVVRGQLQMPPSATSFLGRVRAVSTNLYNKLVGYPRVGLASFELLREEWGEPDIIHVQALWPAALIARRIKRRYGIPYVVTEHSEEYLPQSDRRLVRTPGVVRLLLRPLARGASRTIAVSSMLAGRLSELGLAVDPVVIPNVVPVSEASPRVDSLPRAITHVSIMGPAKNLGSLLEAVRRLRERRTDFVVRLVGDGECRSELESLSATLGVTDFVEFTGRKSPAEVREILAASAFTVVSSTHETFSVSAAESLMAGRPVLSTRCGGPEEFITPEVGRLIAVDDVDALAAGLDWMLDHYSEFDPDALHDYAVSRFSPAVVAYRIVEVYRKVLDE